MPELKNMEGSAEAAVVDVTGNESLVNDPPKKRSLNSFMLFCQDQRSNYDAKSLRATEITKQIAEKWRNLSDDEKNVYKERARQLRAAPDLAHQRAVQGAE